MMAVYKYPLRIEEHQEVDLPEGARDGNTIRVLGDTFAADDAFKDRAECLSYCLKLGIETYLAANEPVNYEDASDKR